MCLGQQTYILGRKVPGDGCRSVPKVGAILKEGVCIGCCEFPHIFWRSLESEIFPKVLEKCEGDIWKKESTHIFFGGMFV